MSDYIQVDKADLTLYLTLFAALFAWYAWQEASAASYHARDEPIPVGSETADPEDAGDTDE